MQRVPQATRARPQEPFNFSIPTAQAFDPVQAEEETEEQFFFGSPQKKSSRKNYDLVSSSHSSLTNDSTPERFDDEVECIVSRINGGAQDSPRLSDFNAFCD